MLPVCAAMARDVDDPARPHVCAMPDEVTPPMAMAMAMAAE